VTYLVVGAAWSQRETSERCLERFTDELRFLEVESDTVVTLRAIRRTFGELLTADDVFHRTVYRNSHVFHEAPSELRGTVGELLVGLRHAGVGHRTEHRCLGRRTDVVK